MVYQGGELEGKQGEVGRVKSTDVGRVLQILVKVFILHLLPPSTPTPRWETPFTPARPSSSSSPAAPTPPS